MKQLNKIKFTDSKNMNVRMLPKRELQKMLKGKKAKDE